MKTRLLQSVPDSAAVLGILVVTLIVGAPGLTQASNLYFTATGTNQIWAANQDGSGAPSVVFSSAGPGPAGPVGIDYDMSTERLFWGTGNNNGLWMGNADGTGTSSLVYNSLGQQHDVEIDEANSRLFFTDQGNGVFVGPTNGSGPVTEVYGNGTSNPETDEPVTVAYDPWGDLIYFGGPNDGSVFVGAADGSGMSALYTAVDVRDIAIDPIGGLIYWVDLDYVWRAPIDGSGTPIILFDDMGNDLRAIEINLVTNRLFLGEFDESSPNDLIWTANADGTGAPTVLYSGNFGGIRGLTLVPEPSTFMMLLGALAIAAAWRRRRRGWGRTKIYPG